MNTRTMLFIISTIIIGTGTIVSYAEVDVSITANFSELGDYGEWVIVPGYGTVWRPDADPDWRPFTYGHWVYTNDGWMWDSDEPFGWIVSHYGNWYYDDDQGWVWLPGFEWSPARVRWQVTDNEIGWAPMFPEPRRGHRHNTIQMQWTFAPLPFFTSVEVRSHVAVRVNPPAANVRVPVYAGPPDREFVQRSIRTPITSITLDKVRVTTGKSPLVRVQVRNKERSRVEVPVGPRYKRITVRSEPTAGNTIGVTREQSVRPAVGQEPHGNARDRLEPRPAVPQDKVRVKTRDRRDDDEDGNKKVRIEVRDR